MITNTDNNINANKNILKNIKSKWKWNRNKSKNKNKTNDILSCSKDYNDIDQEKGYVESVNMERIAAAK